MLKHETSVGDAFRQAYTDLLADLRDREEVVVATAQDRLVQLRARLETTSRHILEHFRFEEQGGYMDAARKQEPRLKRTVQALGEEHCHLEQALEALCARVAGLLLEVV